MVLKLTVPKGLFDASTWTVTVEMIVLAVVAVSLVALAAEIMARARS